MYKKIKYVQALLQCSELFLSSIVPSSRNVSLSFFPKTDAKKCTISQLDYARQVMTVFFHSNPAWLSSFLLPFALLLASRWRWWLWTTSRPKPLRVERCRTFAMKWWSHYGVNWSTWLPAVTLSWHCCERPARSRLLANCGRILSGAVLHFMKPAKVEGRHYKTLLGNRTLTNVKQ